FALAREQQQRLAVRALHHIGTGGAFYVHQPEPLAPVRRIRFGAFKLARYRMALAGIGKPCIKTAFRDLAGWLSGKDSVKRGAPDAGRACIIRARRDQHCAPIAHIFCNIVEVNERQNALPRVAVENDELEFCDFLLEQLARGKSDQRQLVDRRAVLLFRWPQNRKMDQIDRGVGLEQIAPGALSGMWLAGHQQYAQLVAHAVNRNDRAIINLREFAVERRGLYLHDVWPGMWDRHIDFDVGAQGNHTLFQDLAIASHCDFGGTELGSLIIYPKADGLRLTDDAEARRQSKHDPTVDFVVVARNQRMQGGGKSQRGRVGGDIMNTAVGDQDGTGDTIGRYVGERRRQGGEQLGAVGFAVGGAGFGNAHFQARNTLESLDQGSACVLGLLVAIAEVLARAFVDDDGGNRRNRVAVFPGERGVCEGEHHQTQRKRAKRRSAASCDEQHRRDQNRCGKHSPYHVRRYQRSK